MAKKFGFALLVVFLIALVPTSALFACTVNCANGSCSGTGSCTCENGNPKCIDQVKETEASLVAQAKYARSFDTPGLNRFADAAEKIADAMARGDKDSYFIGVLQREDALKSLSQRELNILNSWDGTGAGVIHEGPRQK